MINRYWGEKREAKQINKKDSNHLHCTQQVFSHFISNSIISVLTLKRSSRSWLFRIATNNTIDHIRKRRLKTLSIENTYTDDDGQSVSIDVQDMGILNPQDEAIKAQKEEIIQAFVSMLPAKYQKLVRLRYFHELSYEEIAVELDAPLGTVKAQLHRARELMYDLVKNKKEHI